jgi:hypothetical protein
LGCGGLDAGVFLFVEDGLHGGVATNAEPVPEGLAAKTLADALQGG